MAEETASDTAVPAPLKQNTPVDTPEKNSEIGTDKKKEDTELYKKIIDQIEYYFGNYNLPRDKFLILEIKKDDGWVSLDTMLKFARLAKLTKDAADIVSAVKAAEKTFMEIDSEGLRIRRSPSEPLPELNDDLKEEALKRTVYCKGFPKDGSITLDDLFVFFKQFGDYDSIRMRNYVERTTNAQGFKGSILVVFKSVELARKFMERSPIQYKKTYLVKKWFSDYLEEKKQEVEERRARKQAKLTKEPEKNGAGKSEFDELPKGIFLRATGFSEKTSREDIKAAVFDLTNDCAFVDFKKGDEQAYIRFTEANSNKEILSALADNLKVNDQAISLFLVEGKEEEELLAKANEARRKAHEAGGGQKKRKLGGFGRGGRNKRQKTR